MTTDEVNTDSNVAEAPSRLTEAQYLERAQQKAIEVAEHARSRGGMGVFFGALISGEMDGGIVEMSETAKQHGWYELLQDTASDIVMAAAVCGDPKRAMFYTVLAGVARGDYHDELMCFIRGAK